MAPLDYAERALSQRGETSPWTSIVKASATSCSNPNTTIPTSDPGTSAATRYAHSAARPTRPGAGPGTVSLRGAFVKQHADELCGLVRNTEELEKSEHPLERLIAISDSADGLDVTTTGLHLAQRIGHALEAAYDGELQIHYNHEEYYVDIHWQRD